MKKKIAVTGGIGSGKSTVLQALEALAYPVFSCDEIYREIIAFPVYIQKIKDVFPDCIMEGQIDKQMLATTIFYSEEKRLLLNSIAHPLIMQRLFERMDAVDSSFVFAEVPLLFEGKYEGLFDGIFVVLRDQESRIESLMKRDFITKDEIRNRMLSQFNYYSEEATSRFKSCNAMIIKNDGTQEEIQEKIKQIMKHIS